MKIKISSDSTCDLGAELCEKYDVGIVPLKVILGETVYTDGVDIVPADIFAYVEKTGILPKTSAPSVEEYCAAFAEYLKGYDAVVHVNISAKTSSSHDNAVVAAREFGGKVQVIDSLALSTGQGLLVLKACDFAAAGLSPEDIADRVNALRPSVNTSFVPDRLDYLHKGGRCSLAALMGAKVLRLHPMIDMKDGQMYAKKKYMGDMTRSLRSYINDLAERYPAYDKTRCFITHSSCDRATVDRARAQVESLFGFEKIYETVAGSVITGHCGRGTLGVLFIAE